MTWTDRSFIVSLWTSRLSFHPSFYFLILKEVVKLSSIPCVPWTASSTSTPRPTPERGHHSRTILMGPFNSFILPLISIEISVIVHWAVLLPEVN